MTSKIVILATYENGQSANFEIHILLDCNTIEVINRYCPRGFYEGEYEPTHIICEYVKDTYSHIYVGRINNFQKITEFPEITPINDKGLAKYLMLKKMGGS